MRFRSFMLVARRRERIARSKRVHGDDFPMLAPREWADLPTYHPRAS